MKCHAKWRLPLWAGAMSFVAFGLVAGLDANQKPAAKKSNRVHVVQWAKDATLSRKLTPAEIEKIKKARKKDDKRPIPTYKTVAEVKAGSNLEVPDIVETKKQSIALAGGQLVYHKYGPNTRMKYVTVTPTELVPSKPVDVHIVVEKGKGQFRVGTLTQPSVVKAMGPMVSTAAKGTAYSVNVQGQKTTLIVAEGKVDIYLESAPGAAVTVNPREKFVYTSGDAFPEQATPIVAADEQEIRDLLSLPVQNLYGYVSGRDIRRPDAENIVVTHVEVVNRHQNWQSSTQQAPSNPRPNVAYRVGPTEFWTYGANARQPNKISGFVLDLISHDGNTIYASKPNQGLWRMDWNGANKKQISKKPLSAYSLSPDGKRILAISGWKSVPLRGKRGEPIAGKTQLDPSPKKWVVLSSGGGNEREIYSSPTESWAVPLWTNKPSRLYVSFRNQGKTVDADARPTKIIPFEAELSTGQQWLFGSRQQDALFYRISDGKTFVHSSRATRQDGLFRPIRVLVKEKTFTLQDGSVAEIENPGIEIRAFDDAIDTRYPEGSNVSPNGEILAYLDRSNATPGVFHPGLAAFADSIDLSRFTITAVTQVRQDSDWNGGGNINEAMWLSGNKVMFGNSFARRVILTLGVKRPASASTQREEAGSSSYFPGTIDTKDFNATEFVVTDVSANGAIIGFTKFNSNMSGYQDFVVRAGSRKAETLPMGGVSYPERIYDDGLVLSRAFGSYPDGKVTWSEIEGASVKGTTGKGQVVLESYVEDPDAKADNNGDRPGKMLYYLWNPRTTAKPTELIPPEPGATLIGPTADSTIGWVSKDGNDKRRIWLGKSGETPKLTGYRARYMEPILGEDGKLYISGGSGNNQGMKHWISQLTEDGKEIELTSSYYDYGSQAKDEMFPSLSGVTRDGIVYGADFGKDFKYGANGQWNVAQQAWVIYRGTKLLMKDLLGEGYTMTQFRRITPEGRVCGSIYYQGKPVIAAPNLYELLKAKGLR